MSGILFLYCFGSCTGYLLILGDSAQPLLVRAFGASAWFTKRSVVIAGVSSAFIFPMLFGTRLAALKGALGGSMPFTAS